MVMLPASIQPPALVTGLAERFFNRDRAPHPVSTTTAVLFSSPYYFGEFTKWEPWEDEE